MNERTAYQALLAAESELDTFLVRYAAKMETLPEDQRLRGKVSSAQLNSWLAAQGMTTETTNANGTKNYSPLQFEGTASDLTLVSFGSMRTMANKVVLQNYQAGYRPAYNIRADAPLLSYPNVDVTNNASVIGENWQNSDGTVSVAQVNAPTAINLTAATQP